MTSYAQFGRRTALTGLIAGAALAALPHGAQAATSRPWTIPALREWSARSGSFWLNSPATIVVSPTDAARLTSTAEVLADDLRAMLSVPARVVVRGGDARRGEVRLRLGANDPQLGDEGYRVELGPAAVITANTATGAFYGTRSLLQLLAKGGGVPAGVARDWPRYPERGLMVDTGRKHFSYEWLADRIRECAYLKLNYLQLWFSENLGWRIESETHPKIASAEHLTKQQVRELIALAQRYHVTIIGGIDMPGHLGGLLKAYPEYALTNVFGQPSDTAMDFTIPEARSLLYELIDEYLELFPGKHWMIGGDEYIPSITYPLYPQLERYAKAKHGPDATAKDGVFGFINEVNTYVRARGRVARITNDDLNGGEAVRVDPNMLVEWWTDISPLSDLSAPKPAEILERGHKIHNISWYPTYYSNLPTPLPLKPDLEGMYATWRVHRFRGPIYLSGDIGTPYHDIDPRDQRNLGSRLSVWNDDPNAQTETEIAQGIHPRLRIMAQHTWESPLLVPSYDEFRPIIAAVGDAPGVST